MLTLSIMLSCLMLYVVYYVFVIYAMQSFTDQTRGSNEPWDRRVPLRHIDRRVLQSYSLEWLMGCMWYFGELTKLRAYCVMCFSLLGQKCGLYFAFPGKYIFM